MPQTNSQSRSKPSVVIVGCGRLGTALALALTSSGHSILALVSRRAASARRAASLSNQHPLALAATQLDRLPVSDLILITTPDDAILSTAGRLALTQKGMARARAVLHTSGALSSDVLLPLAEVGFHFGSIHPLISVSEAHTGAEALRGAFYCIEGDAQGLRVARSIVRSLKGRSFSVKSNDKALYHAGAVMASGHLVALLDLAAEILARCGLSRSDAQRVLLPLVESTVKNLMNSDPAHALTGTFARGDLGTVQRHLNALSGNHLEDALQVYKSLGRRSLELAERNGMKSKVLTSIKSVLDSAAPPAK